jgi:hypothetical protein
LKPPRSGAHKSAQQRRETLAPLPVADGAAKDVLEHGSRRRPLLARDQTDAGDEQVLEQLGIDLRDL